MPTTRAMSKAKQTATPSAKAILISPTTKTRRRSKARKAADPSKQSAVRVYSPGEQGYSKSGHPGPAQGLGEGRKRENKGAGRFTKHIKLVVRAIVSEWVSGGDREQILWLTNQDGFMPHFFMKLDTLKQVSINKHDEDGERCYKDLTAALQEVYSHAFLF